MRAAAPLLFSAYRFYLKLFARRALTVSAVRSLVHSRPRTVAAKLAALRVVLGRLLLRRGRLGRRRARHGHGHRAAQVAVDRLRSADRHRPSKIETWETCMFAIAPMFCMLRNRRVGKTRLATTLIIVT